MRGEWGDIPRLSANYLRRNVPNDARTVNTRLCVRANEVLKS
jgi:hypothetical protein